MSGLFKSVGNIFSGLFGGQQQLPPLPIPEAPPAPPSIDTAAQARQGEDAMLRRKGAAATLMTGPAGAGTPKTAAKTLLGG